GRDPQGVEAHQHRTRSRNTLEHARHAVPREVQPHGLVEVRRLHEQRAVRGREDAHQRTYSASGTSVMNMWPGECVTAKGGRDAMSAGGAVTPQAQTTGSSPPRTSEGSPKSGGPRSVMPRDAGSPMCTGAPCTAGVRPEIRTASATREAGMGRIDTTISPRSL